MKTIVRADGNIGPFDSIDVLEDRLRCYRHGQAEDYALSILGAYTISEDPAEVPRPVVSREEVLAAREAKRQQIEADRDNALYLGVAWTLNGVPDVIQTRPQDQVPLLTVWTGALEASLAGTSSPVIELRGESNVTHLLTPEDALAATGAARAFGGEVYRASWARKDALDAIDLNAPDALEQIAAV